MKKSIKELDVKGKKVLLRLDLNVPLNKQTGEISDDTRILESLSTINYLCENGAKLIICSHLGRPNGERNTKYSLMPVAKYLIKQLMGRVHFASDCIGNQAQNKAKTLNLV